MHGSLSCDHKFLDILKCLPPSVSPGQGIQRFNHRGGAAGSSGISADLGRLQRGPLERGRGAARGRLHARRRINRLRGLTAQTNRKHEV